MKLGLLRNGESVVVKATEKSVVPAGEVVAEVLVGMCLDPVPPTHKLCADLQA